MSYNRFIGSSPIVVPVLIITALILVSWYRPGPSIAPGLSPAFGGSKVPVARPGPTP